MDLSEPRGRRNWRRPSRPLSAALLWRATLNRAVDLSRTYSAKLGRRSLDVLHVASALELRMRLFVTYDKRQQDLARAVELKTLTP